MDVYEWDAGKYTTNLVKHGIPFELVYEFDWSKAYFKPDRRFDYGEDRVVPMAESVSKAMRSFTRAVATGFGSSASDRPGKRR